MLAKAALDNVGEFGIIRAYPGGTQLFAQGDSATGAYLLRRGVIKLIWCDPDGRETIVGLRWPGSFVGAPALIATLPSPTSVVTLVECAVEQIPGDAFVRMLRANAAFAMRVQQAQSQEIVELMHDLGQLGCISAMTRLGNLFRKLAGSAGDQGCLPDGRLRLPLKRKELAALLAISPEHLSRILREMVAEGSIAINDQWIIVRPSRSTFAVTPTNG